MWIEWKSLKLQVKPWFVLNLNLRFRKNKITRFNLNDQTVAAISVIDKPFLGFYITPRRLEFNDADHHFNQIRNLNKRTT